MLISASYKTDIPAYYGDWFINRLKSGYCRTVNPYGGQIAMVDLSPGAVDGFVFWTRNLGPLLGRLDQVAERAPFVVQYTITGYPRALDAATPGPETAFVHLREVAAGFGPRAAVWRYDPVVLSSLTPPDWHRANFARLAAALAGSVDEVVVSVVQVYRKTAANLNAAARAAGFEWWDPALEEKGALLSDLAEVAAAHGLRFTVCCQPELMPQGAAPAACIDVERLSDIAGYPIGAKRRPHRTGCGCGCWASKDIGAYDSCPQGCAYCYAVRSREAAKRRLAAHDPEGEFLFPPKGAA